MAENEKASSLSDTKISSKSYKECLAIVSKLNVIDDVFFNKIAEDIGACEEIVQTILGDPNIKIIFHEPQRAIRNIGSKSVTLDLRCIDSNGHEIAVEVQKKDTRNHQKRVRYYISNLDTLATERGVDYKDIKDIYFIYISKTDFFHEGRNIYHIERRIAETGKIVYNGINEIYVNTKIKSDSKVGRLMKFFLKSPTESNDFPKLAARTKYYKTSQEGVVEMCDLVEEYARKRSAEENANVIARAEKAEARADKETARADAAEKKISAMQEQMSSLVDQLDKMQKLVTKLTGNAAVL